MVSFKTFVQEQIAEAELSEEDMKKFFDEVSAGWTKGEGKK